MGDEFKDLWKRQGKDEGMVANILKGFSKVIGKGGMTRLLAKCALKQVSNKSFSMEYYTNRVGALLIIPYNIGVEYQAVCVPNGDVCHVLSSTWSFHYYHGGL